MHVKFSLFKSCSAFLGVFPQHPGFAVFKSFLCPSPKWPFMLFCVLFLKFSACHIFSIHVTSFHFLKSFFYLENWCGRIRCSVFILNDLSLGSSGGKELKLRRLCWGKVCENIWPLHYKGCFWSPCKNTVIIDRILKDKDYCRLHLKLNLRFL